MNSASEIRGNPSCDDYTVAWLCVTSYEIDVATACLDEQYVNPLKPNNDTNAYTVGRIGAHKVVIVKFTRQGTNHAGTAVTHLLRTFKHIRFGLMVGIGGGATDAPGSEEPTRETTDILLGDVVVSRPEGDHGGIFQYDLGTRENGEFTPRSHLNSPGNLLISNVDLLARDHRLGRGHMASYIEKIPVKLRKDYFRFPGRHEDLLFSSEYCHPNEKEKTCRSCDRAKIQRTPEPRNTPVVHHGLIASGNTLFRDARLRDTMRRRKHVLCFEMEAAGLMNNFPCLAIRGISDYADTHKNDVWQPYAALTAAAYAKDLLAQIQPEEIVNTEIASRFLEVIEKVDQINENFDKGRRLKLLEGLTNLHFSDEQERLYEDSVPTGDWLFGLDLFQSWVKGATWQLRLYGGAGTGKTHLCALVVHRLQQMKPLSPVIYIYLSDEEHIKGSQTPVNLLGSLIKQLLQFKTFTGGPCEIPATLQNADESHHYSERILKQAFEELLRMHERTYLIVDGFYQCSPNVVETLKTYPLSLIRKGCTLSLLTTAPSDRQASKEISCDKCEKRELDIYFNCPCNDKDYDLCPECKQEGLTCPIGHPSEVTNDTARVEVRVGPNQLELLCYQRLQQATASGNRKYDSREYPDSFLQRNPHLIKGIAQTIAAQAEKNFLVAQSWIDWLLQENKKQQTNGEELLPLLFKPPFSRLVPYVTGKLERIKRQETSQEKLGFDIFCLLMTARQPLTILALQHALALGSDLDEIREEQLEDRLSILKATNGLITIEKAKPEHANVSFFHGTLPTIFEQRFNETPLCSAESKMADICLKYLKHPDFERHCEKSSDYPFASYVLEYWGDHVRNACLNWGPERPRIITKVVSFLTNDRNVEKMFKNAKALREPILLLNWLPEGFNALHLCAWFGLHEIIDQFEERGHRVQAAGSNYYRTPLHCACARGHKDTVSRGSLGPPANKDIIAVMTGIPGTGRSRHELGERMEIISILLEKRDLTLNAVLDGRNANRTLLMHAVRFHHDDFVERLLVEGSDVNIRNAEGHTALWIAVEESPAALLPEQADIIRLLLRHGADPNLIYQTRTTVLVHAVVQQKLEAVAALLECDSLNLNAEKNIIHIASATGYPHMDQLHLALLRRGVSYLNVQDENGLTPLHYAALIKGEDVSKRENAATTTNTLTKLGANPTTADDRGCTPYVLASLLGQTETRKVLLQTLVNEGHDLEPDSLTTKQLRDLPALSLAEHGCWATLHDVIIDSKNRRPDLAHRNIVTGETILHLAIHANQLDIIRLLLQPPRAKLFDILRSLPRPTLQFSEPESISFRELVCNGNVNNDGFTPLQLALQRRSKLPDIAELLLKYHDDSCVCGLNNAGKDTTGVRSETEPSPSSTLINNGIGPVPLEKHPTETSVSLGVGLQRRLFSAHSLSMVLVLALSMSLMWVSPWDGRGTRQENGNEGL